MAYHYNTKLNFNYEFSTSKFIFSVNLWFDIPNPCSSWDNFHLSLERAKKILNQT
eukprot:UN08246